MYCTISDISINGALSVDKLLNFDLQFSINSHFMLTYRGFVNNSRVASLISEINRQSAVEVKNNVTGENLFVGLPLTVDLSEENGINYLTVICISYSYLLDLKGTSMSFQHGKDLYSDILRHTYQNSQGGSIVLREFEDRKILSPIFKYKETDWEFSIRMAARVGTIVYPNYVGYSPEVYFGVSRSSHKVTDASKIIKGIWTAKYTEDKKKNDEARISDYKYISVESSGNFHLGESITLEGTTLAVVDKQFYLKNDTVLCRYKISSIIPYIPTEKFNLSLGGRTLKGTAIATSGEQIKVHFNIDEKEEIARAHWFSYKPIVGNVMHIMPQIGTIVMAKFNTNHDDSLQVTHVMHENSHLSDVSDYNHRFHTTEFRKRLAMIPKSLYFRSDDNLLELNDNKGINAKTTSNVKLTSGGNIKIKSKSKTTIKTPEHIYITKLGSKAVIDITGSEINIKSPNTVIESDPNAVTLPYPSDDNSPPTSIGKALALTAVGSIPTFIGKGE